MTDHAAEAARSAAVILAPDLGRNLPVEVEAALAARVGDQRPDRFFDVVSVGTGAEADPAPQRAVVTIR